MLLAVPGRAQVGPGAPRAGAPAIVERLPADIGVVVCLKNADVQRRSAPGQAVLRSLSGAKFFAETGGAWVKLAGSLGWEPEEAFVRLAGRQLVFVLAGAEGDARRPWAVLSDVDDQAERRLLTRLRPAPRKTIAGHPVLSLEDGRFELAVFGAPRDADRAGSFTIVLAPTGRGDLLDRIVSALAGRGHGAALGDVPALRDALGAQASDLFVMVSRGEGEGREEIVLAATLAPGGWKAHLSASPGLFFRGGPPEEGISPWSAGAVEDLGADAVALVMSDSRLDLGLWTPLFLVPTLPEATERLRGLVGQRIFAGLFRARDPDGPTPGVAVAFGADAPDIAALAAPADAVIGRLVGALEAGVGASDRDRPDFAGFLPWVPRVVPLRGSAAGIWRPLLGPRPLLAWAYASAQQEGRGPGWWLTALAPSDERHAPAAWTLGTCRALAAADAPDDLRARVSAGMVRVNELVRWLGDIHADPTGALTPFRCLDAVRWDTWLAPGGRVEGTVRVNTVVP
jgi:hypothetical protein